MSLTPEAPGPWILDKTPDSGDVLACNGARSAIVEYLFLGEEIDEPDFFVSYDSVAPIVESWREMVEVVYETYLAASHRDPIDEADWQRVLYMRERGDFYLEILDSVYGSDLDYQRQEIYIYILRPLLLGLYFESYFDAESAVIAGPADYCQPQLLMNNLGYSVNYYKNFATLMLYVWGPAGEQAAYDFYGDLPSDTVEAIAGPYEKYERVMEDHIKPVAQNLAEIGSAAGEVVVEGVSTLASVIKNPFGTAIALGALIYFLNSRRK